MPGARNGINPFKSSLVSQFLYRIKVEMHIYPASATPTQLKPYHVCEKDFLSSQLASEISKDARPERHGHIERSNSTLGNKGSLARGEQQPACSCPQANRFVPGASSCPFCQDRRKTIVSIDNQNYYQTIQPKFPV